MTRDELIERLKAMPENSEVMTTQLAQCCCGDCFLPMDTELSTDDVTFCPSITHRGRNHKSFILIS